ncbi:hypothetical protein RJ640_013559 [Escallonia rubra]|uniref:MORN repeat-containing protein 3 n=1 Tax=Escallonia rubra TaxID=112253 RepID=A0AA88R1Y4_9ASTE|nr:hypothetical protein RJ640_013559 [Escallonia rubra]
MVVVEEEEGGARGEKEGRRGREQNAKLSSGEHIDVKLEEEDQAILLFSSLPKPYETLKTTLLIGKEILHVVKDVMSALMNSSRVKSTSSSSQGEDLVVRAKSRGKQDKSSIECWYHKEIGHIARKCPKKKYKKNGKKHVDNANVAEEDDKNSDDDLYLTNMPKIQRILRSQSTTRRRRLRLLSGGIGEAPPERGSVHRELLGPRASRIGQVPLGDGCMYQGDWKRGKASGKGKFSWPSGATFEGEFKLGRMEGFGTFTGSDGDTYRGSWTSDRKHGYGQKRHKPQLVKVIGYKKGSLSGLENKEILDQVSERADVSNPSRGSKTK